jgi:hypothetical protein
MWFEIYYIEVIVFDAFERNDDLLAVVDCKYLIFDNPGHSSDAINVAEGCILVGFYAEEFAPGGGYFDIGIKGVVIFLKQGFKSVEHRENDDHSSAAYPYGYHADA